MKKLLLSLSAAVACMSMSAAVPVLKEQYKGSFDVAAEKATYSNPSAYDAQGNLIITGKFKNEFTFNGVEVIGEGVNNAFIVKYDSANAPKWAAALAGSATVTAVDTDAQGNIYVGGTFAGKVEFLSATADGEPSISKEGLKDWGEFVGSQNAGFIAKYKSDGTLLAVESYVPTVLPAINDAVAANPDALYFGSSEVKCLITGLNVDGGKLYVDATVMGNLEIESETFDGTFIDMEGWIEDLSSKFVFSLNTESLDACKKEVSITIDGPLSGYESPSIVDAASTVVNGKIYAAFVAKGFGDINYVCGENSNKLTLDGSEEDYVFFTADAKNILKQNAPQSSSPADDVAGLFVDNGTLYAVATAKGTIPALSIEESTENTTGVSDIFVASFNAANLSLNKTTVYKNDEGADMGAEKPNYETISSAALVDGAIYINTAVYNYNQNFLKFGGSYWFDGSEFSVAPATGTGIAVGKGVMALATSDATQVGYTTYTFEQKQTAITDIEAEFDENAPVEYFNLQGIRVDNPSNGLYIRRQGNKVEKILVK